MSVGLDIQNIGSGYNRSIINTNFLAIQTALNDALSRSGTSPNNMESDLDLDSNDVLNVNNMHATHIFIGDEEITTSALSKGYRGWSPSFSVVSDSDRRVLRLSSWVGGEGDSPTDYLGQYVGSSGFVTDIASAVDIRGAQGASGAGSGDMLAAQNLSDVDDAPTAFANIKQAATTSATGVVELATDAETETGTDTSRAITPSNLTAKEATVSEYRANTADRILTTDVINDAMAEVALTDGATIDWDMSAGFDFSVTLGGNRTLANPTNVKVGQRGRIKVTQDATGNRSLTKSSNCKTAGGAAISLSSAAGSVDYIDYDAVSATNIRLSVSKAWA